MGQEPGRQRVSHIPATLAGTGGHLMVTTQGGKSRYEGKQEEHRCTERDPQPSLVEGGALGGSYTRSEF